MATGYMMRYKGLYNLTVPYDLNTKDFVRNVDTKEFDNYHDIRIDCRNGSFICHYGGSILIASFQTTLQKKNILKVLDPSIILNPDYNWYDFTFNAKNIDVVATIMGAKTSHKNRSPFSVKNLPKQKYNANNAGLMKEVSTLLFKKYGLHGTLERQQYYIKKFKIKIPQNNKLKLIEIFDEENKLQKILEMEKENNKIK